MNGKAYVGADAHIGPDPENDRLAASRRGHYESAALAGIVTPLGSPGSVLQVEKDRLSE